MPEEIPKTILFRLAFFCCAVYIKMLFGVLDPRLLRGPG
jgi:hypothetical protein